MAMTTQEIATALNVSEAAVGKAIAGMGEVNPSMLPEIKTKLEGGKMTIATPTAAIAKTEKKSTTVRRTAKMKKADEALALRRDEAAVAVQSRLVEQQPQHLELLDAGASDLSLADDVVVALSAEITADIQAIGELLTPELRALKTMQGAQKVADKHSAAMQAKGLTVAAIVSAALPKKTVRRTLDDIFEAEMTALEELVY
jgi:transcription initiation factor TFIIIB Brf1 subunit/transcription initiation factor TFIIB